MALQFLGILKSFGMRNRSSCYCGPSLCQQLLAAAGGWSACPPLTQFIPAETLQSFLEQLGASTLPIASVMLVFPCGLIRYTHRLLSWADNVLSGRSWTSCVYQQTSAKMRLLTKGEENNLWAHLFFLFL